MRKLSLIFIIALFISLQACNIPVGPLNDQGSQDPVIMYTAAAQTVQAELTRLAQATVAPVQLTPMTQPTSTPIPTNTSTPSATPNLIPCNRASYNAATIDVTIPDWTIMTPGQVFSKTWRLTNSGTCTWTSSYQLVFHSGDLLGVPSGYAQSLTSTPVPPGGTVDITVINLIAPATSGNFEGRWWLREPGGEFFGLGNNKSDFMVRITVSSDSVISLNPVPGESGSISGSGSLSPNVFQVGDTVMDDGKQIFLSFDISSIPAGSTIKNVKFDETIGYSISGAPFTTLGCLFFFSHNYGVLDAGDFVLAPPAGGMIKLCSPLNLAVVISGDDDWTNAVQARVGTTRFQMRMQFTGAVTDFNATEDMVKLGSVILTINYKKP